jgi:hypothetical protein
MGRCSCLHRDFSGYQHMSACIWHDLTCSIHSVHDFRVLTLTSSTG